MQNLKLRCWNEIVISRHLAIFVCVLLPTLSDLPENFFSRFFNLIAMLGETLLADLDFEIPNES